jgi:hypothetical protein
MKNRVVLFLVASLALSCQDESDSFDTGQNSIVGTWLFVRAGYSSGGPMEYHDVSAIPPKTITFEQDSTMSSTNMLDVYKHYRFVYDTTWNKKFLVIFEDDPGRPPYKLDSLSTFFLVHFDKNYLDLGGICFEDCSNRFKRIPSRYHVGSSLKTLFLPLE